MSVLCAVWLLGDLCGMERSNVVTAPQIQDVQTFFSEWKKTHSGNMDVFFEFMTTPSVERMDFLARCRAQSEFQGTVMSNVFIMRSDG